MHEKQILYNFKLTIVNMSLNITHWDQTLDIQRNYYALIKYVQS